MIVRYGVTVPDGFLPVFSVNTAEEAERLLILACRRNYDGQFVAPELAQEQTLDNLWAFGDRLERLYETMTEKRTSMKIEMKPDPLYGKSHTLVTIEHRGRIYATRWANPAPSEDRVREAWEQDRRRGRGPVARRSRTFRPYNQSTDLFIVEGA